MDVRIGKRLKPSENCEGETVSVGEPQLLLQLREVDVYKRSVTGHFYN